MTPPRLRTHIKNILKERGTVKLAIFGPGKNSPWFEKRLQARDSIQTHYPDVNVTFRMTDDLLAPTTTYAQYEGSFRPETVAQLQEADVVLILLLHHEQTAFTEWQIAVVLGIGVREKCAVAVLDNVLTNRMWFYEALHHIGSAKVREFTSPQLARCEVARDIAVELFDRVVLERWGRFHISS